MFLAIGLQCSEPCGGGHRDGGDNARESGRGRAARCGLVQGKLPRRLPSLAMTAGLGTLFLYQYSRVHRAATTRADGRRDGTMAEIADEVSEDWGVGRDSRVLGCGGKYWDKQGD